MMPNMGCTDVRCRSLIALVGLLLASSLVGFTQGKPTSNTAGSPTAVLFSLECAGCHAEDGHGFENMPGMPNLRDRDFQKARTDEQFADSILNGMRLMPTFKLVLSPDQVRDLVAYARTLPSAPAAAQQDRTNCATCHGAVAPGSFVQREKLDAKPRAEKSNAK
jgi:mono/diheme cytochrome c family protein